MPFKDVREFIDRLEKEDEAIRIKEEVDWNLEAGAMLRRSAEAGLPAPFFQKVKGYPEGYRLFGGGAAKIRRIAIAMDMNPDTPHKELVEEYIRRKQRVIKPVLVNDGPCKENVHLGDEVDLLEFPVPMVHDGDGGRYIGTWHLTICKDLDSDWVNWGMYRHMLHNKNTVGIQLSSTSKHLGQIYSTSYAPKNKPMEVAIAIGMDPVLALCSTSPMPHGVSEVDVAGGIRGEPVELIKCETVNLAVPATAEIVIEGEIKPHENMDEGPFGEYTGYASGLKEPRPVIRVKAVTHRNNPILTISCPGIPVDDDCIVCLAKEAELLEALRARGLPVTSVSVFPETAALLTVVAVKSSSLGLANKVLYPKVAEDIAHVLYALPAGYWSPYLFVVEDDVDPFNMGQVFHAVVSKCHPSSGIVKLERSPISTLMPFLDRHERQYRIGARVYFDCTWPVDWEPADVPRRVSFVQMYPLEVQQKALAMWHKYGY